MFWHTYLHRRGNHSTPPATQDKTRLGGGFGLTLGHPSEMRRFTVNRSPAFDGFVLSGFPIGKFRESANACFHFEAERCLVLKTDVNEEVIGRNVQFHSFNDFASGLRERQNTP